jgi:dTDP-4-amino-4,6-dideoxygalactose transaminase
MAVNYRGMSLLEHGDISATSFHATKLFNTGEGGACVTSDEELDARLRRLRFFGHDEGKEVVDEGCNAKMTEVHAALGLANLPQLPAVLEKRREIYRTYRTLLDRLDFVTFQKIDEEAYNFSYMPVVFDSEDRLQRIMEKLAPHRIFPRRYFHPALNTIKAVAPYTPVPISEEKADRILCLPSFHHLSLETVELISRSIEECA